MNFLPFPRPLVPFFHLEYLVVATESNQNHMHAMPMMDFFQFRTRGPSAVFNSCSVTYVYLNQLRCVGVYECCCMCLS